jgi:hypothetical protein
MFPFFFNVAFIFENIFIHSSNVHVYSKHISNYKIESFLKIIYDDVVYIKMVVLVPNQTFQLY